MKMIQTPDAPQAIGPYSQAVKSGNFIFVSGQLPLSDGQLIEDPAQATTVALQNMEAILRAAGADRNAVVRVGVFVRDIEDFDAINGAYQAFFADHKPARALVEVARLPKDAVLEIEAVAAI